ncbi:MAG: DUF72 domain-containing protein [Thermodesulfobacteriota bacterium]
MGRGRILVGTSGWNYPSWREHLYRGVPRRGWLAHAARTFGALEVNGSFYVQIARQTYRRWRDETPPDTRFAVKGHRFVTHYKRLRDVEASIVLLRDQASGLGDKLEAVVWQLPSSFAADLERLAGFLRALHAWRRVRHAIEFRHRSWFTAECARLLARHGVAVCVSDAPDFPLWDAVTADFVYVRLHGHTRKYASCYSRAHLRRWAERARTWSRQGRDVYLFFDNDAEGHAVRNALGLREELTATGGRHVQSRRAAAC